MENVTQVFTDVYHPCKALLIYQSREQSQDIYIESYDIGKNGKPINAHPLSYKETLALAQCLNASTDLRTDFLKPKGLLPKKVLYISPKNDGYCVWHTPAMETGLLFIKDLDIPSGKAKVPALLWKANKQSLNIYALNGSKTLTGTTPLFHAPFFNIYSSGNVCMGTVNVDVEDVECLETFIEKWEQYFFGSYFSHLLEQFCPVTCNIVQLWQKQLSSGKPFPAEVLIRNNKTIKDIIG